MRIIFPTLIVLAATACAPTATEPELKLLGESSTDCVNDEEWSFAIRRGAVMYEENCDFCHQDDGAGQAGKVPRLVGNQTLLTDPDRAIRLILTTKADPRPNHGMAIKDFVAIFEDLGEADVADVLTYARASWGNCADRVSVEQVKAVAAQM